MRARQVLDRIAFRRTHSFGAASVTDLVSSAAARGIQATRLDVHLAVADYAHFVEEDWFRCPEIDRGRFADLSRRMLAVKAPLSVAALRGGVCRASTSRGTALVPPERVMTAVYGAEAGFSVDGSAAVWPRFPLDERELPAADRLFVEVLRASWIGVLDGDSFRNACSSAGMSGRAFAFGAARSAVLDQGPGDIWFLRGTRVSSITAAALRRAMSCDD